MKGDNFRLIAEVRKRRPLWDTTMQMADRKDMGNTLWQEVADIMKQDVQYCKKRFKGFRDSYRSEIRKIQQHRIEHSNCTYFRALEFLRDIFDPDCLVPFRPQPLDVEFAEGEQVQEDLDSFVIDVDNDSFDFEIMGDIFKRNSVEAQVPDSESDMPVLNRQAFDQSGSNISMPMNRSDVESSPRLLSPLLAKPQAAKRARRRKTSSSTDGPQYHNGKFNGYARATPLPASDSESDANIDPDRSFLVSLVPHVKMLTPMNNLKFRMEVTRLLMDLNQQDEQPISPSSLNPASAPNYNCGEYERETTTNGLPNTLHAANAFLAHSSVIECDVKIENEPMF